MEAKPPDGDGERPKVRATFASLANCLAPPKPRTDVMGGF